MPLGRVRTWGTRRRYLHTVACVVRLQALARGLLVRVHARRSRSACVKLQAWCRALVASLRFACFRRGVVSLQARCARPSHMLQFV